jgi:hypothetical protein
MKNSKLIILSAAGMLSLMGALPAVAQDNNALLEALVRKGVLTDREAEEIRLENAQEVKQMDASKIKLNSSLDELKLYGDVRLRYQYDDTDQQVLSPTPDGRNNDRQRSRWRFRLRLGAEYKFKGPFFAGVMVQTVEDANSTNKTFDNGFDNYGIFISKAYIGWDAADWATIILGKQDNPFYTTNMVWDSDINPSGFVEVVEFHKLFGHEETYGEPNPKGGYSKDGKENKEITATRWVEPRWSLTLNAGQFVYDSSNEESDFDSDASWDSYLFVTQLVAGYEWAEGVGAIVAPGFMFYNAAQIAVAVNFTDEDLNGAGDRYDNKDVIGATRDLRIVTAPGEIHFPLFGMGAALYWDFAWNTAANDRAFNIYRGIGNFTSISDRDKLAWLVGLKLGKAKKAGSWGLFANWRETGFASLDPNLTDSDFNGGRLNAKGVESGFEYAITDNIVFGLKWLYAWNLDKNLVVDPVTGGNVNKTLQVDLSAKF